MLVVNIWIKRALIRSPFLALYGGFLYLSFRATDCLIEIDPGNLKCFAIHQSQAGATVHPHHFSRIKQ